MVYHIISKFCNIFDPLSRSANYWFAVYAHKWYRFRDGIGWMVEIGTKLRRLRLRHVWETDRTPRTIMYEIFEAVDWVMEILGSIYFYITLISKHVVEVHLANVGWLMEKFCSGSQIVKNSRGCMSCAYAIRTGNLKLNTCKPFGLVAQLANSTPNGCMGCVHAFGSNFAKVGHFSRLILSTTLPFGISDSHVASLPLRCDRVSFV